MAQEQFFIAHMKPRLAYFFGTSAKVRVLENVTTGEICDLTEHAMKDGYHVRKVETNRAEPWDARCTALFF